MKFLILISFIHFYTSSVGQLVKFQLYIKTSCDQTNKVDSSYFLKSISGKKDTEYTCNTFSGILLLPDTGKYEIYADNLILDERLNVQIKDTGLYIYKYEEPKIVLRCYGDPGCFWETCNKKSEGYQDDYYPNGNIKIRGNFVKGKIEDSLIIYYLNGTIKKSYKRLPGIIIIKQFDSSTHLLSIDRNSTKSFYLTDYIKKQFFINGKIKLEESRKNNLITIKEYYENGNLKVNQTETNRTEYFQDRNLHIIYQWSFKKDRLTSGYDAKIYRIEYDSCNNLKSKQIYEGWSYSSNKFPPKLDMQNLIG